jgi:hypothetical protein
MESSLTNNGLPSVCKELKVFDVGCPTVLTVGLLTLLHLEQTIWVHATGS